jgi:hypothetical protein
MPDGAAVGTPEGAAGGAGAAGSWASAEVRGTMMRASAPPATTPSRAMSEIG